MIVEMSPEARARMEAWKKRKMEARRSPVPWMHRAPKMDWTEAPPPDRPPPEIGSSKSFVPAAFFNCISDINGILHRPVTGRVVYVHEAHRWYRVEFPLGDRGAVGHECFKF